MIILHPVYAGIWNLKGIVHNDFEDISQGKGPTPGVNLEDGNFIIKNENLDEC